MVLSLLLFIFNQAEALLHQPEWKCSIHCQMIGNSESLWLKGNDKLIGNNKYTCINNFTNESFESKDTYEVRLEGLAKTAFGNTDKIYVKIVNFNHQLPASFVQKFKHLHVYPNPADFSDTESPSLNYNELPTQSSTSAVHTNSKNTMFNYTYSEEQVEIHALAIPINSQNPSGISSRAFVTINTPTFIANDVEAFLSHAELIIDKKPSLP